MATTEETPEGEGVTVLQLITRDNRLGVGIDVGWQTTAGLDIWWGNTRNVASLRSLIEDARRHGYEFVLSPDTQRRINGDD